MGRWGGRWLWCAPVLAAAIVTLLTSPRPAAADQLCLDGSGNFAPCPGTTTAQSGAVTPVAAGTLPPSSTVAGPPRPSDGSAAAAASGPSAADRPSPGSLRWLIVFGVGLLTMVGFGLWVMRRRVDTTGIGPIEAHSSPPARWGRQTMARTVIRDHPPPAPKMVADEAVPPQAEPVVMPPALEPGEPSCPVGSPATEAAGSVGDVAVGAGPRWEVDGPGLVRVTVGSLAEVADGLGSLPVGDEELVLVLPPGAVVVGEPDELVARARLIGGICVAASAVAVASAVVARRVERAVAEAVGSSPRRCHPYPGAMMGPAGPMRALLADAISGERDADGLTEAMLSGDHDVVLDTGSRLFHVLDGTGSDVAFVAGRPWVGDEQPLVLIDPTPGRASAPMRWAEDTVTPEH